MDLVFIKYKAACSEPLSQALGPVPGVCSPAVSVPGRGLGWVHGHSGPSWAEQQGAYFSPEALPSQPLTDRAAQAQRGAKDFAKLLCRAESPSAQGPPCTSLVHCSSSMPHLGKLGLTGVFPRESL